MVCEHRAGAVKLNSLVFGRPTSAAAPLTVLHGMLGSARNWRSLGPRMAERLDRVVSPTTMHGFLVWARSLGRALCLKDQSVWILVPLGVVLFITVLLSECCVYSPLFFLSSETKGVRA